MQLLLVEDELEIQRFLKQSLTDAGYEVDVAKDGRTAAQLASGKRYDVLIVDLGLPDQDGYFQPEDRSTTESRDWNKVATTT